MKLPEDKKERMKFLIMIFIGVAVAGYVLVAFGIIPLLNAKKAAIEEIAATRDQVEKAEREIALMAKDRVLNLEALKNTRDISEKYFLRPRIGNFLLSATEFIEEQTRDVGITLEPNSVKEIGPGEIITAPSDKSEVVVKTYTAHVVIKAGYNQLLKLLHSIETANPLITITAVSITGDSEKPEVHNIQFDVQWPIWATADMPTKLDQQIKANEISGGAK